MVSRIILDTTGIRVSKVGYDASSASAQNMAIYSGMTPCIPLLSNVATFTGSGSLSFSLLNPSGDVPMILMKSPQGIMPASLTYYAETRSPYNSITIYNVDGVARTVEFKVLL